MGTSYTQRRGIRYYRFFLAAGIVRRRLGGRARVVLYGLGYAVQYYPSGPYFPEMEEPCEACGAGLGAAAAGRTVEDPCPECAEACSECDAPGCDSPTSGVCQADRCELCGDSFDLCGHPTPDEAAQIAELPYWERGVRR